MKVFVGGPIQFMSGDPVLLSTMKEAVGSLIQALQVEGIQVHNAHLVEHFGATSDEWHPCSISERDLGWMRDCDAFVALLPPDGHGNLARTDGTHVELGWASALGKPIVLVVDSSLVPQCSQLVQGLSAIAAVQWFDFADAVRDPSALVRLVRGFALNAAERIPSAAPSRVQAR